jgi:uncharacterized protein
MKIHIHEITDHETELDFTQEEPWVLDAVKKVDELTPEASIRPPSSKPRAIQIHFSLRKVDDVVVVQGDVRTSIQLLCSRCANPFQLETHPRFSALFCKDPVMAGVAHLQDKKPAGQNQGFARHAHDHGADEQYANSPLQDLDITYLAGDHIDLQEVLREQLQLQVPFQPLCQDECKGICANCGADLNVGRCACAKVTRANPFAALGTMKVYAKSDS